MTGANIGRQLAIILDNRVQSGAASSRAAINDEGRITGNFTQQEAQDLSLTLRSGALPASLTYLEERTVGPSLGADSIRAGIIASLVGLGAGRRSSCWSTTSCRASTRSSSIAVNLLILLGADGLPRRDHDAAGHRRLHPDDRHGRRLERADLRAHQGRAAATQGRRGRRSRPASTASSARFSTRTSRRSSRRRSCSSSAPARSAASRRR